ncbi:MAG TPA: hypothetical protein VFX70_20855 [Mycobacteriales bacterium]|nr:hypothetical protein [Mycobacteriales bacterium]
MVQRRLVGGGASEWPGLTADPNEVRFDPKKMSAVADALQTDLDKYQDALQNLNDPYTGTDLSPKDLGTWDVASDLALAAHKAHLATVEYLQAFLQQYQNVIGAIRKSAGNLSDAEDRTATQVGQVGGDSPPAAPSQSASFD